MGRTSNAKPGDPTKIVRGLTTVFDGLHEMFEGITEQVEVAGGTLESIADGMEEARETSASEPPVVDVPAKAEPEEKPEPEPKAPAKKGARKVSTRKAKEPPAEEPPAERAQAEDAPSEFESIDDAEDAEATATEAAATEAPRPAQKAKTALTADDIRKVVVAKIKQKRDNSKAVQSLLEAYGVKSLGDMEPEKYESFLSDISQL